ncbi:hypothetical protein [Leptotrichia sp. oral taxon 879]|uniref:hypothetical protein n=1 Tax=Leptotrichia sp. oral taxon 879 TaxID=1227267 RepID=UPI0003ADD52E|nr:hypothetical protein [Leptotrichia sp. oral taxon 879]ERK55653.1 hypothetical protein HMPREF1552_00090 [Leptotrichia sp. oral taxon 879 str. F0557]
MDKRKILEQYYNENQEEKGTKSEIERKEMLKQYYSENKNEEDNSILSVGMYVLLVFIDALLLNVMSSIGFEILKNLPYSSEAQMNIFLWIIDVLVLALFLYTVKQTIKHLKKL